jgi:stage V sporulation protein R
MGRINPYHLGFNIFQRIHKKHGMEKCLAVRECYSDETFVQEFVDEELCYDLNLFSFSKKKVKQGNDIITIDDVADEPGWKEVRNELVRNVGINSIPNISVIDVKPNRTLVLKHDHDGRDLELNYAQKMVGHVKRLWGEPILLETIVEEEAFIIDDEII